MADFQVIQILLGEAPPDITKAMLSVQKAYKDNYKLITEWEADHNVFYDMIPENKSWHWLRSDVIRFEYLSKFKNTLYLDWDVKVNEVPGVYKGVTWAFCKDYWAIYNGDCLKMFKDILEEGISKALMVKDIRKIRRNWLMPCIVKASGSIFDKKFFAHKG